MNYRTVVLIFWIINDNCFATLNDEKFYLLSYQFCNLIFILTALPFMIHCISAAGFDAFEVQFTLTVSPTEYRSFPPVIFGPSFGRTEKDNEKFSKFCKIILESMLMLIVQK